MMKNITFSPTKQLLIYLLIAGGIITLSLFAPQLPYQLLKAYWKKRKFDKRKFKQVLKRLENQKTVTLSQEGEMTVIRLTEKGKIRALKYKVEDMKIKKPKKWDKKWRIVIFDIPHKKKLARDILRWKLRDLGFIMLQKSVFIQPYPCQEEINFIRELYEISPYVELITAESIENEEEIKSKFNL